MLGAHPSQPKHPHPIPNMYNSMNIYIYFNLEIK